MMSFSGGCQCINDSHWLYNNLQHYQLTVQVLSKVTRNKLLQQQYIESILSTLRIRVISSNGESVLTKKKQIRDVGKNNNQGKWQQWTGPTLIKPVYAPDMLNDT